MSIHPLGFGSTNVWRNHKVTHATGASRRCLKSPRRSFLSTPATLAKDSPQWRGLISAAGMQCTVNKRAERPEEGAGELLTRRGGSLLTFPQSWLGKKSYRIGRLLRSRAEWDFHFLRNAKSENLHHRHLYFIKVPVGCYARKKEAQSGRVNAGHVPWRTAYVQPSPVTWTQSVSRKGWYTWAAMCYNACYTPSTTRSI